MTFVQITDTHFVPRGETLYGLSPGDRLSAGIALIERDHADAAFVLVTGDLAHHGQREAYAWLRETLTPLRRPVHLMLGNHDSRAPFLAEFPESPVIEGGFVQFALDAPGARILCLDSLHDVPGDHAGRLCDARLAWLDREIAATPPDLRLILACHHPPFDLGMPDMDDIRLRDADALWEVLARRRPDQMIFGHVHRPICGAWRGIPFHIQRGFNHQVALVFERRPVFQFCDERPDIALLRATADGVLVFTRSVGGETRWFPAGAESFPRTEPDDG